MTISLCMIVRNEATCLARCLASLRDVADELIVVDTGSDDATPDIARSFGARVVDHQWEDDFAAARNVSLGYGKGDWVLVLDADEWLEPPAVERLRAVVRSSRADGLKLIQRNLMPAGSLVPFEDTSITRLFRNRPWYRYEQVIHEQIAPSIQRVGGVIEETDVVIMHDGYAMGTVEGRRFRAERNLRLLVEAARTRPADPYLQYQLGVTLKALGRRAEASSSLERALASNDGSLSASAREALHMKLAQLALERSDYGAAVVHAEASLAENAENLIAWQVLGMSYVYTGRPSDAERCFATMLRSPRLDPSGRADVEGLVEYCQEAMPSVV